MFKEVFQPRFCETDALGHISNTTLPIWFETARVPIFRLFSPDLSPKDWHLILARFDLAFERELFYQHPVEVRTAVCRIGNSSFELHQEAWQQGARCVVGKCTMVHFDYAKRGSKPLPDGIKRQLAEHLVDL